MTRSRQVTARRILALGVLGLALILAPPVSGAEKAPEKRDNSRNVSIRSDSELDPIEDGTPRKPSRDVGKVKREQQQLSALEADPLVYDRDGYTPHDLPADRLPYAHDYARVEDTGLHDEQGVRMFSFNGQIWDHPVFQGGWGLRNLSSYRVTKNQLFLDRAIANAQRNLDRKVESRGAWWYPYDFDLSRCTGRPLLRAPWSSGMAQGRLLTLFVRLYEVTGDEKWRTAADYTFASLTLPPDAGAPWASWVDGEGHFWLEEYPETAAVQGERVMNGHIAALYGVYDYWRVTRDARSVEVLDGAATTVRRYLPVEVRMKRWASRYSLECPFPHLRYHIIHTAQALSLYDITYARTFALTAYLLRSDYPTPAVDGGVRFSAGTHTGYKFDSSGRVVASKSLKLTRSSGAHADQRIRVYGRNFYYRITNGAFAGYLVLEEYPRRYLRGKAVEHTYTPNRTLKFQPRTYTGYRYASSGRIVGSKVFTLTRYSTAPLGATAWVNGRMSYQVTAGVFNGYWLPVTTGLSFG
ncbi:MAG: D-glucuronyl C5-epimerase family protein [Micromonosporaceae bacterium]